MESVINVFMYEWMKEQGSSYIPFLHSPIGTTLPPSSFIHPPSNPILSGNINGK